MKRIPVDLRRLLRPRQDMPIVVEVLGGGHQYQLSSGAVLDEDELDKRVEELNLAAGLPQVVAIDLRDE